MTGGTVEGADHPHDLQAIRARLRAQAAADQIRVTQHAQQEMTAEDITLDDVIHAISTGQILENYAEHQRGACCLRSGLIHSARALHVLCSTTQPVLIIIAVYEPTLPKWLSPTVRRPPS